MRSRPLRHWGNGELGKGTLPWGVAPGRTTSMDAVPQLPMAEFNKKVLDMKKEELGPRLFWLRQRGKARRPVRRGEDARVRPAVAGGHAGCR